MYRGVTLLILGFVLVFAMMALTSISAKDER